MIGYKGVITSKYWEKFILTSYKLILNEDSHSFMDSAVCLTWKTYDGYIMIRIKNYLRKRNVWKIRENSWQINH